MESFKALINVVYMCFLFHVTICSQKSFNLLRDSSPSYYSPRSTVRPTRPPFDLTTTVNSTSETPEIITLPDDTSTEPNQFSTEFPIWTVTPNESTTSITSDTPNITTVNPNLTTTLSTTVPTTINPTTELPITTLPPEPPIVPWNLTYGQNGNFCIMADFASKVDIYYKNRDGEITQTGFNIPPNATIDSRSSYCLENYYQQVLALNFESSEVSNGLLVLTFTKNPNNQHSTVSEIRVNFEITEKLFPLANSSYLGKAVSMHQTNLSLFETEPMHSFSCSSALKSNFSQVEIRERYGWGTVQNLLIEASSIETSDTKVQAFMPDNQEIDSFMTADICPGDEHDDVSSTIPITVGGVLLFMVVVVLIAYFVGRNKHKKKEQEQYSTI